MAMFQPAMLVYLRAWDYIVIPHGIVQWVDFSWENLQETNDFNIKYGISL